MANFRRRSRFRRELIEKQSPQESLTFTSLGSRLASFKYQPDPDLECKYRLENTKAIFMGACAKCTLHSSSTFLKESLSNFAPMQNSLEGRCTEQPSKASSSQYVPLAEIDFQQEISNHRYVRCGEMFTYANKSFLCVYFSYFYTISFSTRALKARKDRDIDESLQEATALNNFAWAEELASSSWTYRIVQWFRRRILYWLFPRGILYHPGQLEVLERCAVSQTPFLFLPVHKSEIDLLLVKQVLSQTQNRMDQRIVFASSSSSRPTATELPTQPGIQLQSPQMFSQDGPWAVQQSVIESIFKAKGHILTFLEPLINYSSHRPQLASLDKSLLDHALQCIYDNTVQDIQIVPVGISYYDDGQQHTFPSWPRGLLQYLKGSEVRVSLNVRLNLPFISSTESGKHKRCFLLLFAALLGITWPSCSMARVDFDQPFSLKVAMILLHFYNENA